MLKAPIKYLQAVLSNARLERNISLLTLHFISESDSNLHFIIDEEEIDLIKIICSISLKNNSCFNRKFTFRKGQKVISLKHQDNILEIYSLPPNLDLRNKQTKITADNFEEYIPVTNYEIKRIGLIQNKISDFKDHFSAVIQSDFFNNERLLIVGNQNLFNEIPKEYPSCFVSENEKGQFKIEYNSVILPKICILKNINLLEKYLDEEINGESISFYSCIFVGTSKFENSINTIRKYYNQKKFPRVIFIGEKDIKVDLGNNQIPLRWKWTIPELHYFNNRKIVEHEFTVVQNAELENSINQFYEKVKEIETRHLISLRSIYRFIGKLYYNWSFISEINKTTLIRVEEEFRLTLRELLEETFFNIDPGFDFQEYYKIIHSKYIEIIKSLQSNNKTEKIRTCKTKINQFVVPSFLQNLYLEELKILKNNNSNRFTKSVNSFSDLTSIIDVKSSTETKNYISLFDKDFLTEIVSLSKSNDENEQYHKLVSSIYGFGKIEKFIERLAKAKTQYTLFLYSIEERLFKFHINKYVEKLNCEYVSTDRYQICGSEFNDDYFQFTTFDHLIESIGLTQQDSREIEYYKIIFTDYSNVKLPSTKSVLKIYEKEKKVVKVEDLSVGEEVQVYENPDKETLRSIFELEHPDLIKKADEYSNLWQNCLINYLKQCNNNEKSLYDQLTKNGFSVSINTLRKYLQKEVMFPGRRIDLIAIAKTVNDISFNFDLIRNVLLPLIHEFKGKMIEYGFVFSESINLYLTSGEIDNFFQKWEYKVEDLEKIVLQIPIKKIKDIKLLTSEKDTDD